MRFTDELRDKINSNYGEAIIYKNFMNLNIDNSIGGVSVYRGNWEICKVEEIDLMIRELVQMKKTIEEAGIIV